jgi:hypothetical protein
MLFYGGKLPEIERKRNLRDVGPLWLTYVVNGRIYPGVSIL